MPMNNHRGEIIVVTYFTLLLLLATVHLPSFDTFYYWEWSRHLALSYYDGSPMIAYFIKLSTLIFNDTLFAFNSVGIVCAALTSWIIYRTARLFLSKEASFIAMFLWLFSPLVTLDILQQTTYDTPLLLFWSLTLYFVIRWMQLKQTKDLYWIGISIGLMLLSKYSGIVLVLGLFLFMLTTHRDLLKTRHFYAMLLIPLMLFSPVIIWNQQHHWQSFSYQLATHQLDDAGNPVWNIVLSFICIFIPSLNFMFIAPVLCWLKKIPSKNKSIVLLCGMLGATFIAFYLLVASLAHVRGSWLTPYLLTSALLGGYCFQTYHYRNSTYLLIGVYALASLGIYVNSAFPLFVMPKKTIDYRLMQNLNATYPQLPKTVIATGWLEARMLYFLKNKPYVYTLACDTPQNQYALWSTDMVRRIENKSIKEVVYIDTQNRVSCIRTYFDHCTRLPLPAYAYKDKTHEIYAFTCTND